MDYDEIYSLPHSRITKKFKKILNYKNLSELYSQYRTLFMRIEHTSEKKT